VALLWHPLHKLKAIPWLWQTIANTVETSVNTRPVHVGFVMGKVALGQDFLQVLLFYPARIILVIPSEWEESIQSLQVL